MLPAASCLPALGVPHVAEVIANIRRPKDNINIRILQTMISGIPLSDPYFLWSFGPLNLVLTQILPGPQSTQKQWPLSQQKRYMGNDFGYFGSPGRYTIA